jgi:hypothetical protein
MPASPPVPTAQERALQTFDRINARLARFAPRRVTAQDLTIGNLVVKPHGLWCRLRMSVRHVLGRTAVNNAEDDVHDIGPVFVQTPTGPVHVDAFDHLVGGKAMPLPPDSLTLPEQDNLPPIRRLALASAMRRGFFAKVTIRDASLARSMLYAARNNRQIRMMVAMLQTRHPNYAATDANRMVILRSLNQFFANWGYTPETQLRLRPHVVARYFRTDVNEITANLALSFEQARRGAATA